VRKNEKGAIIVPMNEREKKKGRSIVGAWVGEWDKVENLFFNWACRHIQCHGFDSFTTLESMKDKKESEKKKRKKTNEKKRRKEEKQRKEKRKQKKEKRKKKEESRKKSTRIPFSSDLLTFVALKH
jgi:hypothetical protein